MCIHICSEKLKKYASSQLMTTLAIFSLLFMWTDVLPTWLRDGIDKHPEKFKYYRCAMHTITTFTDMYLTYVILLFTVFRCISVVRVETAHIHCSKRRANYALLAGALFSVIYTAFNVAFVKPVGIDDDEITLELGYHTYDCVYVSDTAERYLSVIDLSQLTLFFCIIICGNVIIIYGVSHKRRDIDNFRTVQPIWNLERQVTLTALAISFMYLIPTVFHLFVYLGDIFHIFVEDDLAHAKRDIADSILHLYVMCMFSFGHFACYSITGSRFRQEMKKNIKCCKVNPMLSAMVGHS